MTDTVSGIQQKIKQLKIPAFKELTFWLGRETIKKDVFTCQLVGSATTTNRRAKEEGGWLELSLGLPSEKRIFVQRLEGPGEPAVEVGVWGKGVPASSFANFF